MSDTKGPLSVLMVGESWIKHTVHLKGFDQFHTTEYEEGAGVFLGVLASAGYKVTYIRAHEVSSRFPKTKKDLEQFDVVVLSDVGSNTFLLCDETFLRSERTVNRLSLLAEFVENGGGLVMVGGYMSFAGIDGRARYGMSPLAAVLPVEMLDRDDRIEAPEGVVPTVEDATHPAMGGTGKEWPILLGYNKVVAKKGSKLLCQVNGDPVLVVGTHGKGRAAAFTSDLAPHWAPPEFLKWPHYGKLWTSILTWASGRS